MTKSLLKLETKDPQVDKRSSLQAPSPEKTIPITRQRAPMTEFGMLKNELDNARVCVEDE